MYVSLVCISELNPGEDNKCLFPFDLVFFYYKLYFLLFLVVNTSPFP